MFAELKNVVDLIRVGIYDFRAFREDTERERAVLEILKAYFVFKDCVDEGEALVVEAGADPIAKIAEMEASSALVTIERWDAIIRRQGMRLYTLQGYIFGQHHLSVIDPALQDRISEAIGYKMDRAVTLHGIGAALFFKNMFPIANTHEEKAKYVALMAGEEQDTLNMQRVEAEITSLRDSLNQYRNVVSRMVTDAELLRLSQRAREEAPFSPEA
ncbi:hypothetical protein [Burkholderia anthina]|uniref:hypothetical protein n=1 Tax=Burkholderia anthina TaxID=179879 RepID=UPI00158C662B|nr:hypothetical protein [Burkholderia anthina]